MITILYDTAFERDAFRDFIKTFGGCVDFSDDQDEEQCALGSCRTCIELFLINNVMQRTDYNDIYVRKTAKPASCSTCANAPICWLSTTAAAPAPCRHYLPEVSHHEGK